MDDNLRFLLLWLLLLIDRIRLVKLTEARVSGVIGLSLHLLLTLLFLVKSSLQVSDSVLSRDISRASCNSCRMTHERCLNTMHLLIIHMLKQIIATTLSKISHGCCSVVLNGLRVEHLGRGWQVFKRLVSTVIVIQLWSGASRGDISISSATDEDMRRL